MKPKLKPPGTKRLELKCDVLLSTSAFKFDLRRYALGLPARRDIAHKLHEQGLGEAVQVEAMKSKLTAPGIERLKLKHDKTAFKRWFQIQLALLHLGTLRFGGSMCNVPG